jgi:pseudouridine-5'-phosphate glycosidase
VHEPYNLSSDVAAVLAIRGPVVALETTVVTHGLPHPQGVSTALALEDEVRNAGATPATIGILGGAIRVGLTPADLTTLATAPQVVKVNLSNLAAVVASGHPGSTTVAATMFAAHACGIRVFATGGIGGVHREVIEHGDVSADLTALAQLPIVVVSAGAKAILDLPRTVEMLETLGVPVLGLGTDEFPAFYRRSSGLRIDRRFDTIDELASALRMHFRLGMRTGILVVNPIPAADELQGEMYDEALRTAFADAAALGIRGRAVTPFLLDRMREMTGGESVRANVALLANNARVAAQLAVALSSPRDSSPGAPSPG